MWNRARDTGRFRCVDKYTHVLLGEAAVHFVSFASSARLRSVVVFYTRTVTVCNTFTIHIFVVGCFFCFFFFVLLTLWFSLYLFVCKTRLKLQIYRA